MRITQPHPIGPELVAVGESSLPRWWEAELSDDEGEGAPDVRFRFEVRDGVPECREVHVVATEAGREVQYSGLAGIRVEDVMEQSSTWLSVFLGEEAVMQFPLASWKNTHAPVENMRRARAGRKLKVTDELLRQVADVYRANVTGSPTQAVADCFDRSHRTATLYVKRARKAGHLGQALLGKAGEQ